MAASDDGSPSYDADYVPIVEEKDNNMASAKSAGQYEAALWEAYQGGVVARRNTILGHRGRHDTPQPSHSRHEVEEEEKEWTHASRPSTSSASPGAKTYDIVQQNTTMNNSAGAEKKPDSAPSTVPVDFLPTELYSSVSGRTYRLGPEKGRGHFKTVFLVQDIATGQQYAMSVMSTDVVNEASMMSSLRHEHILPLEDFFEVHGRVCMVCELMDTTLDANIRQYGPNSALALQHARQLLCALAFLEAEGVVHADIKPDNIFINKTGDLKLGDFGLARRIPANSSSVLVSTPNLTHLDPECVVQWLGARPAAYALSHSSDAYALGVALAELAMGRLLAGTSSLQTERERLRRDALPTIVAEFLSRDSQSDADRELQDIVRQCTTAQPGRPSAAALVKKHVPFQQERKSKEQKDHDSEEQKNYEQVCNAPPAVKEYVGRRAAMREALHLLRLHQETTLVTLGRGGWGKTEFLKQLCVELAHLKEDDGSFMFPLVFWIRAESEDTVKKSVSELHHILYPSQLNCSEEDKMLSVRSHLSSLNRFVLVWDNVVDCSILPEFDFLPSGHAGQHTIISSRRKPTRQMHAIDLLPLSEAESFTLVEQVFGQAIPRDNVAARQLIHIAGGYPLLLKHLGVLLRIESKQVDKAGDCYRRVLAMNLPKALSQEDQLLSVEKGSYSLTVPSLLQQTFAQARRLLQYRDFVLLQFCAYLSAERNSVDRLCRCVAEYVEPSLKQPWHRRIGSCIDRLWDEPAVIACQGQQLQREMKTDPSWKESLALLQELRLIDLECDTEGNPTFVGMHRVDQSIVISSLSIDGRSDAASMLEQQQRIVHVLKITLQSEIGSSVRTMTDLHCAATFALAPLAQHLIATCDAGDILHALDSEGMSPLQRAIAGDEADHRHVFEVLAQKCAPVMTPADVMLHLTACAHSGKQELYLVLLELLRSSKALQRALSTVSCVHTLSFGLSACFESKRFDLMPLLLSVEEFNVAVRADDIHQHVHSHSFDFGIQSPFLRPLLKLLRPFFIGTQSAVIQKWLREAMRRNSFLLASLDKLLGTSLFFEPLRRQLLLLKRWNASLKSD